MRKLLANEIIRVCDETRMLADSAGKAPDFEAVLATRMFLDSTLLVYTP
jgi:hypothetical protein